jgi:hypothetical protein
VDDDAVDETNLQRQIVHSTERLGDSKAESAKRTIEALNPDVGVTTYPERLTSENVDRILGDGWDAIVDGADNFPTRYLLNDASVWHDIPVVHGSIFRFEGQVTVFAEGGPVLPLPVPATAAAGAGSELRRGRCPRRAPGRDRLDSGDRGAEARARHRRPARRPAPALRRPRRIIHRGQAGETRPPVCGDEPTITEYIDYVEFCAGPKAGSAAGARPENAERTRDQGPNPTDVARGRRRPARGAGGGHDRR